MLSSQAALPPAGSGRLGRGGTTAPTSLVIQPWWTLLRGMDLGSSPPFFAPMTLCPPTAWVGTGRRPILRSLPFSWLPRAWASRTDIFWMTPMATSLPISIVMRRLTPQMRIARAVLLARGRPLALQGAAGGATRGSPFGLDLAGLAAGTVRTLPRAPLGAQGSHARYQKRLARCAGGAWTLSGTLAPVPRFATGSLVDRVSGGLALGPTRPFRTLVGSLACRRAR